MASEGASAAVLRRVEWLTLAIGVAGTLYAAWRWGWRQGAGFALGRGDGVAELSLAEGKRAGVRRARLVAQSGAEKVRVPTGAYLKFFGRFALLLGCCMLF